MNNLELYRVFKEVAVSSSFSAAAKNLYITQPAVSQCIKQLETSLDTILFIRGARGVTLTAEGTMLLDHISAALKLIEAGETKIVKMKKLLDGELKIGAGDTISEHFLLPFLEKFHNLYPNIKLKVINRTSLEAVNLLKEGSLDIAFLNLPIEDDSLQITKCFEVEDIFVAGGKFSFLKNRILTRNDLVKYPLIMLERAANSRRFVDSEFLKSGINLEPEIELGAHNLLIEFAKISLGISCVIKEFSNIKDHESGDKLFEIKLDQPLPKRWIGICTLSSLSPSFAAKMFINWCYSNFSQTDMQ